MMSLVTLQPALPEDIDELVAIDDDACLLFERAGLHFQFPLDHPALRVERRRWQRAADRGWARFAVIAGARVGFCVWGWVDGKPYLDQVSVRAAFQRQGVGKCLIEASLSWARMEWASSLWLTTYAHLSWNGPYYERLGFRPVAESQCGPELRAILADQRSWLPEPRRRVAMCIEL